MKRIISLLLTIAMLFSMVPSFAFAEGDEGEGTPAVVETIQEQPQDKQEQEETTTPTETPATTDPQDNEPTTDGDGDEEITEPGGEEGESGDPVDGNGQEPVAEDPEDGEGEPEPEEEEELPAVPTSGSCGAENQNLSWTLSEDGKLAIRGQGAMEAFTATTMPWQASLENIVEVRVDDGVTSIGDYAFSGCENLAKVTMPESLNTIGAYAFAGCTALRLLAFRYGTVVIGSNAFHNVSATVTYACNAGWEESALGNYGGNLTWKANHSYQSVVTEPTCTEGGYTTYTCDICNVTYTAEETEALDHAWDEGTVTKESTCEEAGSITYACTREGCEETYEDEPEAIGHSYEDGVCVVCGDAEGRNLLQAGTCGENAFWKLFDNGLLVIYGKGKMAGWRFGDYDDFDCAPWYNKIEQIHSVKIIEGITSIGAYAFEDSVNLKNVSIPNTVTEIGFGSFYGSGLEQISLPDSVTSIGGIAFIWCSKLKEISLPSNLKYLGDGAFAGCTSLPDEDGFIIIKHRLVACIKNEADIVIPYGIEKIDDYSIPTYVKSVVIPDSVTHIGAQAFSQSELAWVSIPSSVKSVDFGAFENCSELKYLYLTPYTTEWGSQVFDGCNNLSTVFFDGTEEEWQVMKENFFEDDRDIIETLEVVFRGEHIHQWKASIQMAPTCYSAGMEKLTCMVPGCTETTYREIEKLEHEWDEGIITKEATCSENGIFTYTCTAENCYEKYEESIPLKEHTFEGRTCVVCGAENIVQNGFCGDTMTWTLYADGTLKISGTGYMNVYSSSTAIPWNEFRAKIKSVELPSDLSAIANYMFYNCSSLTNIAIPDGVTSIGVNAFTYCSGLTSIEIPSSVTSIGSYAFRGCSGLTNLSMPAGATYSSDTFSGCTGLKEITLTGNGPMRDYTYSNRTYTPWYIARTNNPTISIAEGVTSIGSYAFYDCSGLTSITIPESVTSIGVNAFTYCSGLTSIEIPSSVTSIGSYAFDGCSGLTNLTIPDSVTSIGSFAFDGCSGLTSVTIPNSVTIIGSYAFSGCSGLTDIAIPTSVTSIGGSAFFGCSGLTSIVIPDSVTSIGGSAFYGCSGLTNLSMPAGATYNTYSSDTFSGCTGLKDITLTGNGPMLDYTSGNYTYTPWYIARANNPTISIAEGVTSIGSYAFRGCSGLTSITIPDSVTSIGSYAFDGCSGLTSITIPDSVTIIGSYAFSRCSGLTDIAIPTSVTSIGGSAFFGCSGLTSIVIPDSVTSIGGSAFYGCSGLTDIAIPTSVTSIGDGAFYGCSGLTSITIPDSVTSIGSYAFSGCSGLTSLSMPAGATYNSSSFSGCAGLKEIILTGNGPMRDYTSDNYTYTPWYIARTNNPTISIAEGVTSIGWYAFYGCSGLTSITIPDSVTSIGDYAFYNCSYLTSVTILDSVTSIGKYAFYNCVNLYDIYIGDYINSVGGGAFKNTGWWNKQDDGLVYLEYILLGIKNVYSPVTRIREEIRIIANDAFENCTGLISIEIPDSMTSIEDYAFYGCSGLTSIVIPDSVTRIGSSAFYGCSGLTCIDIPSSVTSIGNSAFYNCTGLTGIELPEGVTSIGSYAFYGCSSLTNITIPEGVTSIGEYAFYNCSGLTSLSMPAGATYSSSTFNGCTGLREIILTGNGPMRVYTDSSSYSNYYGNTPWYIARANKPTITISEGVTRIGNYAFYGCTALTNITIPSSVTSIGSQAFYGCSGLTNLSMPAGATYSSSTFSGCTGLREITLTGNGAMRAYSSSSSYSDYYGNTPWYISRANKPTVTIAEGVTSIGNYAFYNCAGMTAIEIPEGVTSIGSSAFSGCSGLTSIDIPSSVTSIGGSAFKNCTSLTNLSMPAGATYSSDTFSGCTGLKDITLTGNGPMLDYTSGNYTYTPWYIARANNPTISIAEGVTSIGSYAFRGCSGLTSITIPDSVTSIGSYAFDGCSGLTNLTIPDSVTSIGSYAFYGCSGLTSITIGNGVTSIGDDAFYGCSTLTSIEIPGSVTSIGNYAFYNCSGLTSITIPDSVTSIGNYAFSGCSGLTSITIPDSVTSIGNYAFSGCSGLTSLSMPAGATYSSVTFSDCTGLRGITLTGNEPMHDYTYSSSDSNYYRNTPWYIARANKPTVTIADGVTSIGDNAFYGCSGLTSITIPDSVTSIGNYAFYNCAGMTGIEIPEGVTSIGDDAFYGCSSLTSITIPSSVTSIGSSSFFGCSELQSVHVKDVASYLAIEMGNTYSNPMYYAKSLIIDGMEDGVLVIPDEITAIPNYAFKNAVNIKQVIIPNGVTSIGSQAFYGCSGLTSLSMPAGATYGSNTFTGCTSLQQIILTGKSGMKNYTTSSSYANYYGYTPWYIARNNHPAVVIEKGVTSIGNYAFYGCSGLSSITIPDSVTNIGSSAFTGCNNLQKLYLPERLDGLRNICECKPQTIYYAGTKAQWSAFIKKEALGTWATGVEVICRDSIVKTGTYGTITWKVNGIGELVFSGTGTIPALGENAPWYPYLEDVNAIVINTSIRSIAEGAFTGYDSIRTVTVADTVTSIGDNAFKGCTALEEVSLPSGLKAIGNGVFENCASLEEVAIPDGVTSIGNNAFAGCSSLTEATLPAGTASVGSGAFRGCSALQSVTMPVSVQLGSDAFAGCTNVTSVTVTGKGALELATGTVAAAPWNTTESPVEVSLASGVTSIGAGTFAGCANLTSVSIPSTVKSVGSDAFAGCTGLTEVDLPKGVESIGSGAFSGCTGVTTLSIPGTATVAEDAFAGCTAVQEITYGGDAEDWEKLGIGSSFPADVEPAFHTHVYDVRRETVAPTCVERGYDKLYCVCDRYIVDEESYVPETGHTPVTDPAVAPTHTATGLTEGSHCSVCGEVLVAQETIAVLELPAPIAVSTAAGAVKLTWQATTGATGYEVYRKLAADEEFVLARTITSGKTLTFSDSKLQTGSVYCYKILPYRLVNKVKVYGVDSGIATVGVMMAKPAPAVKRLEGNAVLTWKLVPNAVSYTLYMDDGYGERMLGETDGITYTIPVTTAGTYNFRVVAKSAAGVETSSVVKPLKGTQKSASLTTKLAADLQSITASWKQVPGAVGYLLYIDDGSGEKLYGYYPMDGETYNALLLTHTVVMKVAPVGSYKLRLLAVADVENQICSAAVTKTVKAAMKAPAPAVKKTAGDQVTITWKPVPGAMSYEVQRGLSKTGPFEPIATVDTMPEGALQFTYVDTVIPGKTYFYKVASVWDTEGTDVLGTIPAKAASAVKQMAMPFAAPVLTLKQITYTKNLNVTWKAVPGATNYKVYRSTSKLDGYEKLYEGTELGFVDSNLTPGVTYYYKAMADCSNAVGETSTPYSAVKYLKVK